MKRIVIPAVGLMLAGSLWLTVAAAMSTPTEHAHEVSRGSLAVPAGPHDQASLAKLARVDRAHAESAALAAQPGQVVQTRLEDEEGFLVWQIDVKNANTATEVSIDAGNGKVLAVEPEEEDDDAAEDAAD